MQLVVEILSEQMVRLPVRFEDVEVPLWAESAEEYKSSVVQFRSQVRSQRPLFSVCAAAPITEHADWRIVTGPMGCDLPLPLTHA